MFETSDILTEFLDDFEYHCNEINAIVHKIAIIVITTINSTRVNAFLFLNIIIFDYKIKQYKYIYHLPKNKI